MAHIMLMPKLGLTMVEGKIGKWFMQEGDVVSKEEPLLQIETDKIVNKVNATEDGTLLKILVEQGDKQTCKEPLCIIGEPGEDISNLVAQEEVVEEKPVEKAAKKTENVAKATGGKVLASPLAKKLAKEKGYELADISGTGPDGRIVEKDVLEYTAGPKASPTAKNIAAKLGIDLNKINKAGRIMKEDVQRAADKQSSAAGFAATDELIEMSPMRKVISERMTESWLTSPAVTYDLKVDATMLKVFKKQIAQSTKVTFTDLIVKIVSQVLIEFPLLNSTIVEDSILVRNYVNMGVAVALDEGLIVPVVQNAHLMGLKALSQEIRTLAMKAKNNELGADELQGGTFTVSNLGMYEMDSFSPVINQPQVAILGITAIKDTVVAVDGEVAIRPMMNLCLTADHRAVDGSVAAQFMARVKSMIENPAQLLL
jgi:pyruvate dehydrogenase E2 component (dihydrolipoamide acetyltransferase)